ASLLPPSFYSMSAAVGLLLPAVAAAIAVALVAVTLHVYARTPRLSSIAPVDPGIGPRVSIIVAARDEGRHIRTAVASLLRQDYHDVELIVVEDRSRDQTPAMLDAMAAKTPRLIVEHVTTLPAGWLGKNHALHRGATRASGEILLFVDGDVHLERSSVSRAMRVFDEPGADHVTVSPHMELPAGPIQMVVGYFLTWGMVASRLWRVEDPHSNAYIGVGAFNMVRTNVYKEVGGHTRIAMRPDDDLMLGKILKQSGAQTRVLFGMEMVGVEWYRDVPEATQGFRKNAYAALNYSFPLFLAAVLGTLVVSVWPFVAVWQTTGVAQALFAVAIVGQLAAYAKTMAEQRLPQRWTLLYPVAALVQTAMLVIAVTRTLVAGGIEWRGTFYPLDQLRANRV
ncbi:MAG TPA: glycosyltransferase family 2 protein, partial [Gemmatimonadaceae bacterium]